MKVQGNNLGQCGIEQLIFAGAVAHDTEDIDDGVAIYKIPHACIITRVVAVVKTAFDGTSPSLIFGTEDDDDAFLAAGDITEGTVGAYSKDHFTEMDEGDEIYAKFTATTPTAGAAELYIFAVGIPEVIS